MLKRETESEVGNEWNRGGCGGGGGGSETEKQRQRETEKERETTEETEPNKRDGAISGSQAWKAMPKTRDGRRM